jgi:hypothetical protein
MTASIIQALVIGDAGEYPQVDVLLGTALQEVADFYNSDLPRAVFRRVSLAAGPSAQGLTGGAGQDVLTLPEDFWQEIQGTYARTYDQEQLADAVRQVLGPQSLGASLLILTDREITPPLDWRYIIWSACSGGTVVSAAPTDPHYWGESRSRVATIKHRVRSACLCVVGEWLGLSRCGNERCFLFGDVDCVARLDSMVYLGEEHGLPSLAHRGYSAQPEDPYAVQPIEYEPPAESAAFV